MLKKYIAETLDTLDEDQLRLVLIFILGLTRHN